MKLLDLKDWRWIRDYVEDNNRMVSMVRAYKASANGIKFMFGVKIPKNVKHALELDKGNGMETTSGEIQ